MVPRRDVRIPAKGVADRRGVSRCGKRSRRFVCSTGLRPVDELAAEVAGVLGWLVADRNRRIFEKSRYKWRRRRIVLLAFDHWRKTQTNTADYKWGFAMMRNLYANVSDSDKRIQDDRDYRRLTPSKY